MTFYPNMLTMAQSLDPSGAVAKIIEVQHKQNPVLRYLPVMTSNMIDGHVSVIRTGIPLPVWVAFYEGAPPAGSTVAQIKDAVGRMINYSVIDKALLDLNGNSAAFRASQDMAIIEGFSQEIGTSFFYGNRLSNPRQFNGLSPRFSSKSATNGVNIIDAGGTGVDNGSIYLCVFGENKVHGIVPPGYPAGLQVRDLGEDTIAAPNGGGDMQVMRTFFEQHLGIVVADWRYVVRIANIDRSNLKVDLSGGSADLATLMFRALETAESTDGGTPVFFMDRTVRTMLREQLAYKTKDSTLTVENVGGVRITHWDGIPIERTDALKVDEARVV